MSKKIVSELMLTLLLTSLLPLSFNISRAEFSEPSATPWGNWKHYHNYTQIVGTLSYLNATHPDIVDVFPIGESWQGRTIYCVRLTCESKTQPKPKVLFVGYHHSNEPISAELPLYFAVKAASDYGTNEMLTRIIDLCEIYIVVALNPDGFRLFEMNDWQRKNARPTDEDEDGLPDEDPPEDENGDGFIKYLWNTTSEMIVRWEGLDNDSDQEFGEDWIGGVDLNRNYGFEWCTTGASPYPHSEIYAGPAPFSEPETQALRDLALENDFKYAVSFHSGAEIILYPWSYSEEPPPDAKIFDEIGDDLSTIIGCPYGQISTSLYMASGTWDDWMYGNRSVIAFTCEIFVNDTEWVSEPGPTPDTLWRVGRRYRLNPRPQQIENIIHKWLPVLTYITERAISEAEKVHDITVTNVAPSKTVVGQGYSMTSNVTVLNQGHFLEKFNVTLYANTTIIQTQETKLPIGRFITITFEWNTTDSPVGNYAMKAVASVVDNETIITNNAFIYGTVKLSIPGDINGDGIVNVLDISIAARAFGTKLGDNIWDSNADITEDRAIDMLDISAIAKEFGKSS